MRIVLKFGSGILATTQGSTLDKKQFARLSREVAALVAAGHECIVVSSGAVAAGLAALGLKARPEGLALRQACAAVGQSKLMQLYSECYAQHGLGVAQLLLTHGDIDSRTRCQNVRNTLECLLAQKRVVPIINENDSVATEELKFGDNDRLSAEVAMLVQADLLILLTSVEGLLDARGNRIPEVRDMASVTGLAREDKGRLSVGGMVSKLQAVGLAVEAGIPTVIASGRKAGRIAAVVAGRDAGTRFPVGRV
ncbi:MAG: Glutamate 5-kinase [Verrucomicrobiota bacterium]|jgi:glutamate 5-kinase